MTQKTITKLKSARDDKFRAELMVNDVNVLHEITSENIFKSLDFEGKNFIYKKDIINALESRGILMTDPRIQITASKVNQFKDMEPINASQFYETIAQNITLIEKALKGDLIIPDFSSFTSKISTIFNMVKNNKNGKVADYIPQLARVEADQYAISVCTIDGQQYNLGDYNVPYSIQSTTKPINYAMALEEFGEDTVHKHIGREPSGRGFNELTLNKDGLPHNPMINAGAIMCSSLIRPELDIADRFDFVLET